MVKVPRLIGLTRAQVDAEAKQLGFKVQQFLHRPTMQLVSFQQPAPGIEMSDSKEKEIVIDLCTMADVPDFSKFATCAAAAKAALEAGGWTLMEHVTGGGHVDISDPSVKPLENCKDNPANKPHCTGGDVGVVLGSAFRALLAKIIILGAAVAFGLFVGWLLWH